MNERRMHGLCAAFTAILFAAACGRAKMSRAGSRIAASTVSGVLAGLVFGALMHMLTAPMPGGAEVPVIAMIGHGQPDRTSDRRPNPW
jgi:hypothetical protein